MAESDSGMAKEQTILSLTHEIGTLLGGLQDKLDNRFCRGEIKPALGKNEPVPTIPNILNEILGELTKNRGYLIKISNFISDEVLPKIN